MESALTEDELAKEDTGPEEERQEAVQEEQEEIKGSAENGDEIEKKGEGSRKRGRRKADGSKKAATAATGEESKEDRVRKRGGSKEPTLPVALIIERPNRERKSVERSVVSTEKMLTKELRIEEGCGTKLKDIPNESGDMEPTSNLLKKGKDKVETTRAVWSDNMKKIFIDLCIEEVKRGGRPGTNLKPQSWTRVMDGFKEKTGFQYGQKQLKNQWDLMRKQYNAWLTLCGQTGIGLNEATHTVTMEPKRWDEYLKVHPEAKIFRTKPLPFTEEMGILFSGTPSTGEERWTPASGSLPDDIYDLTTDHEIPSPGVTNTPVHTQEEGTDEIVTQEFMSNIRRKRPYSSRSRNERINAALTENINRVIAAIEDDKKMEGPTIGECISSLKKIPEIQVGSSLFFYAVNSFRLKENREIWMALEEDALRIEWLRTNMGAKS